MPMGKMWSLSLLLGLLLSFCGSATTPAAEPIVVPLWSDRGESSDPEWSDAAKARMTVIRPDQPNGTMIPNPSPAATSNRRPSSSVISGTCRPIATWSPTRNPSSRCGYGR